MDRWNCNSNSLHAPGIDACMHCRICACTLSSEQWYSRKMISDMIRGHWIRYLHTYGWQTCIGSQHGRTIVCLCAHTVVYLRKWPNTISCTNMHYYWCSATWRNTTLSHHWSWRKDWAKPSQRNWTMKPWKEHHDC